MKEQILKETEKKMAGVVDFFAKEIHNLRVGRASVALLEGIVVEYYGAKMPINQLATVTIPQPQLIVVQPWDKKTIAEIKKAIQTSNLGLNPVSDASVIRIPIPALSEERRKEIIGILHNMAEEARIEIRELRRKANEEFKKGHKEKDISEDDMYKGIDDAQKATDKSIDAIDKKTEEKEKDIMEN